MTPSAISSILRALLADANDVAPETFADCTTPVEGYDYGRAHAYRFCLKLIETVES